MPRASEDARRQQVVKYGGMAAVLIAAAGTLWWINSGDDDAPPEPLSVECTGPGLPEDHEVHEPQVARVPEAVLEEPVTSGRRSTYRELDYVTPMRQGSGSPHGFVIDVDAATVTFIGDTVMDGEPSLSHQLADSPLYIVATVAGFPGDRALAQVFARVPEDNSALAVLLDDEEVLLSCAAYGVPVHDDVGGPTFSRAADVLLVQSLDEDRHVWLHAHATTTGEHLWSAPAVSFTVDAERAYAATGEKISAIGLASGETEWETDTVTRWPDRPRSHGGSRPEDDSWRLAVVGDELYAYRDGGIRLLTFDTSDGQLTWDLVTGDDAASYVHVTQVDEDHAALLNFGTDIAVRSVERRQWSWLRRGIGSARIDYALAPRSPREPALIGISPHDSDLPARIFSATGDQLFELPGPREEHTYALAESTVYVLNRVDGTVTGYDLDRDDHQLWMVSVPSDGDFEAQFLTSYNGGFRVHSADGEYISFREESDDS
ncbi:PQQ-binding-like beta-propeller repeat protein [Phytoactinopolyspora mesophila]|uniref:PQQ-binding-like beta-propeller repeat protein n=1 Tax=Phytoactinopolyspora mesophila TaxID=2650750 RepID=A0A7K3MCG3_9ACTN|nr:PQQ-binding-like beta-propeller repeat protein [Phytoactinopolyspora mesophila]NDL60983.1 PQQ-binding-like beta-propeller repeat protein [Phytoactinopolyspora mesophila]